ncbi:MAG: hypothetical protein KDD33_11720 [Bdellovibrionales bacterium]|nr:hypothetical protein [Bdellovibrionales bacterium]
MNIIDYIGLTSLGIDHRVLKLVQDAQVVKYSEVASAPRISQKIVVGRDLSLSQIFDVIERFKVSYVVQENHGNFLYNLLMAAMIHKFPEAFSKDPLPFVMKSDPSLCRTQKVPFYSSQDKKNVMQTVAMFLEQNPIIESLEQNVLMIANELLLNALYAAPIDRNGNHVYARSPRNSEVYYPSFKKGEMLISLNKDTFLIGCRDPFGSVSKIRVSKRLQNIFTSQEKAQVEFENQEWGGSGLGLKTIIENSSGFGMIVKSGEESFVYATLPIGFGNKKIHDMPKNIYLNFS